MGRHVPEEMNNISDWHTFGTFLQCFCNILLAFFHWVGIALYL